VAEPTESDAGMSLHVKLDADLADRFESWRKSHTRVPTVAESGRRLLSRALADHTDHVAA
jgi:hypothetical protein